MAAARNIRNLVLIGSMGSGKTTVGRHLAAQLHFEFVDTDQLIEAAAGKKIAEIFATTGEPAFRALEHRVVQELAHRSKNVIATGGGLACYNDNLASLKSHALVVCLWASPETIWERVRHHAHRPLLRDPDPLAKIRSLLAARESFYRQADLLISTDGRPTREVVTHILNQFYQVLKSNG
jgi:shikimate kinase